MIRRASWLLVCTLVLASEGACNRELSEAAHNFCYSELVELETARMALNSGRTQSALGELFSLAVASRLVATFSFCTHSRRIPDDEERANRHSFRIARDRYFAAGWYVRERRDFGPAIKEMTTIIKSYKKLLFYPVK